MQQSSDIEISINLDGEKIPLHASVTVGRHLDNDLMVAGEDVLDFQLRLEPTDRGVRAFPLGEASLTINDQDWATPVDVIAGDRLQVGVNEILLSVERVSGPQADEWWLHGDQEGSIHKVMSNLDVGRGDDNEILLLDDHISRKHARFSLEDGIVWLKDLGSANGTFVNGERLTGGCRLFHGDEVSFDNLRFQLVGKGQDLTPVRKVESVTQIELIKEPPQTSYETTEISLLEPQSHPPLTLPDSSETGAYLLGVSEPISGFTYRTRIGTTTIGRDEGCDVVIRDPTVSARHAEIIVRPETTTVTNLLATNGTRVNGQQIQNSELVDGDLLRIGQVNLVFKDVPAMRSERTVLNKLQWMLLTASLLVALGLIWLIG